jgi:CPA1 family monovalent cation:H+ antiporter
VSSTGTALTRELISAERKFIHVLLRDGKITDESGAGSNAIST